MHMRDKRNGSGVGGGGRPTHFATDGVMCKGKGDGRNYFGRFGRSRVGISRERGGGHVVEKKTHRGRVPGRETHTGMAQIRVRLSNT